MAEESGKLEVSFHDFVYMISSSALVGLGVVPNPVSNKYETNLAAVSHTIALLEMIQKKTEGNLNKDEADLLESALHELRIGYVTKAKEGPTEPPEPPEEEEKPGRIILP